MSNKMKKDTKTNYGWVCPNCKTAHAPTVEKCQCSTVPVNRYYYHWWPWSFPYYGTITATLPAKSSGTTISFGTQEEINKSWANTDPVIAYGPINTSSTVAVKWDGSNKGTLFNYDNGNYTEDK